MLLALAETVQSRGAHARDAGELAAAVAAAHGLRGLADVVERQLAARDADGAALVAAGLVRAAATVGETLNHCERKTNKNTHKKKRTKKDKQKKTKKKKGKKNGEKENGT